MIWRTWPNTISVRAPGCQADDKMLAGCMGTAPLVWHIML